MLAIKTQQNAREIVYRTFGQARGAITRLMSPSDLGEVLKPFVFLDLAVFGAGDVPMPIEVGWHPHSGIATVTVMLDGAIRYAETTGKSGTLSAGGVEFMRAGNGVWHTGTHVPDSATAFQLWIALPPELELGPTISLYQSPDEVPSDGPARVLLGSYGSASSVIEAPSPINYLAVRLKAGERWLYEPPAGHTVLWAAISSGAVSVPDELRQGDLAAFEASNEAVEFEALSETEFVLGSAVPHDHKLVLGNYSVHTSPNALRLAEDHISTLGRKRDHGSNTT